MTREPGGRSKLGAMVIMGACCCALTVSCAPMVYEPIASSSEVVAQVLERGDRVRIHTTDGEVLEDVFSRVSDVALVCQKHYVEFGDIVSLERVAESAGRSRQGMLPGLASCGVILGEPTGLTLQLSPTERTALRGSVGRNPFYKGWFHFQVDLVRHFDGFGLLDSAGRSSMYWGIGVGSSSRYADMVTVVLRFPLGYEHFMDETKQLSLFLEVVPGTPYRSHEGGGLGAAAGVRYWF